MVQGIVEFSRYSKVAQKCDTHAITNLRDEICLEGNITLLKMSGINRVETGCNPIRVLPGSIRFLSGI